MNTATTTPKAKPPQSHTWTHKGKRRHVVMVPAPELHDCDLCCLGVEHTAEQHEAMLHRTEVWTAKRIGERAFGAFVPSSA